MSLHQARLTLDPRWQHVARLVLVAIPLVLVVALALSSYVTLDAALPGKVAGTAVDGPIAILPLHVLDDRYPRLANYNGLHSIWSDAPFGITVWGFDEYVSYAYPAGASVRPINNVVVPPTPQ